MTISNYFIKKKIKKLIDQTADHKPVFKAFDQIQSILVLYEMADFESLLPHIEHLKRSGKKVESFGYVRKEVLPEVNDSYHFIVEKTDLSVKGIPADAALQKVLACKPDVIMDLTHAGCYAMQYLLVNHPCNFKIGIKKAERDLHDFSLLVTDRDEFNYLFEQILFYLQNIRTK